MYLLNQHRLNCFLFLKRFFTFHNVSIKSTAAKCIRQDILSLHSTMYLLNRESPARAAAAPSAFTFHNVSIKSGTNTIYNIDYFMFTFHNLSIKSKDYEDASLEMQNLHSTMYLLNRGAAYSYGNTPGIFTFHNLSIKSCFRFAI